jgi:Mitochondrial carrier protein
MTGPGNRGSSQESTNKSIAVVNASSSAAAGIIGRIFTHPLDTVKARLQAPPRVLGETTVYRGPIDALVSTARSEGLRGLYRGFGAVIVGGTPGTVLYLCSYDLAKRELSSLRTSATDPPGSNEHDFVVHFLSGMIAETIACVVYVPVDVIKERMQVQHRRAVHGPSVLHYKNSWDALQEISRTEGLRGIYKGYGATLASFGPFSALYFVFYERFKLFSREVFDVPVGSNDLPFRAVLLSSASAGALASWVTSPLDMAKLRLQVTRGQVAAKALSPHLATGDRPVVYRGVVHCLQDAYATSGIRGLFRGAGARVLHFTPATTITMTSYETCRTWVSKLVNPAH